jgi:hypothetical protein
LAAQPSHALIKISITNDAKPTLPALLSLIRALRAVKTKIILYQPNENDGTQFTQSKICIRLVQKALSSLKSKKQTKEADCPCITWHSVRHRTYKTVTCFLGCPRPALLRKFRTPDSGINVYLFTYR